MDREEELRVLAGSRWLSATPAEFRSGFLALARFHRAEAGAIITLAGDKANDVIGLSSGCATLSAAHGRADAPILHLARAPFWMGYGPMLLGQARVVTAVARSPVRFASFSQARLVALLESRSGWWRPFARLVGEYGDLSSVIATDLAIANSRARCAAVLLRFAGARLAGPADTCEIEVPVSQDELAAAANLSRNSTGTILRRLQDRGLVRTAYRTIIVTAPGRLRALTEV